MITSPDNTGRVKLPPRPVRPVSIKRLSAVACGVAIAGTTLFAPSASATSSSSWQQQVSAAAKAAKAATKEAKAASKEVSKVAKSAAKVAKKAKVVAGSSGGIIAGIPASTIPVQTPTAPNPSVAAIGTFAVNQLDLVFVDSSRKTPANGTASAVASRTLPTTILFPQTSNQVSPILVFGHGLGSNPAAYLDLLRPMASAGYIVVAPTFPLSKKNAPGGTTLADQPQQAKDMKFVVDQVIGLGLQPDSPMFGRVDGTRVAASGHSLGGITTLDYGYSACCADSRLKATVPMSSIINFFSGASYFNGRAIPMLLIHGDADATVPYALGSLTSYGLAKKPKALLTIKKGNHTFGIDGLANQEVLVGSAVVQSTVAFLDRWVKDDLSGLNRLQGVASSQPAMLRLDSEGLA